MGVLFFMPQINIIVYDIFINVKNGKIITIKCIEMKD